MDGPRRSAHLGTAAAVVVVLVVVAGSIGLALDAAPAQETPDAAAASAVSVAAGASHAHVAGFAAEEPITDPETRAALRRQLDEAGDAVAGIRTAADAEAAGYMPVTLDLAYLGVHYVNNELLEQPFSPSRPTHLIFDELGPAGRMIGLMYYVDTAGEAPDGFAGPNDHWHNHQAACMADGFMLALDDVTESTCDRLGGSLAPLPEDFASRWMLHVWVVPGNDNPWGLFADGNPALA